MALPTTLQKQQQNISVILNISHRWQRKRKHYLCFASSVMFG